MEYQQGMKSGNILIVSTYPIKKPQHGGQKRTEAIHQAYRAAFRNVRYAAVFYRGFYDQYDSDDVPLGPIGESQVQSSPLTGDIICGRAIYEDEHVKQRMIALLREFQPDIIHIEQPYPYLGLKPLLAELNMHPKLIFGSQNIEAPMKREILESYGTSEAHIAEAETLLNKLETELSIACDLLVACTAADLAAHKKMGARNVVLAQNGIAPAVNSRAELSKWKSVFDKDDIRRTVLFVGSAHPPNWVGFQDMVGRGLGFVPFDSRIIVAGSISDYFDREIDPSARNIEDATFWLRAISAGRLSEESLGSLIQLSDVIILPITEGGGSNLKTAEAILANKKVVATEHALRSFEWFKEFPNVWVAHDATQFRSAILTALNSDFMERTIEQNEQAQSVEWKNCLQDLIVEAQKL